MEVAAREDFFFNPHAPLHHHAAGGLLHNPRLRRQWTGAETQRAAPAAASRTVGCSYADRCVCAGSAACVEAPSMREIGSGHWVRCHFPVSDDLNTSSRSTDLYKNFPIAGSRAVVRAVNGV